MWPFAAGESWRKETNYGADERSEVPKTEVNLHCVCGYTAAFDTVSRSCRAITLKCDSQRRPSNEDAGSKQVVA